MGAVQSMLQSWLAAWFPDKEVKLCMVGLDNAGKTTALFKLHLGETIATQPTIGSNVESVKFENLTFEIWDLAGQANLRPSWAAYYVQTQAVIVVVDSTDRARMGILRKELVGLLQHPHLEGACILILANKQDLKDAMAVSELSEALGLQDIKTHSWHVQSSCAITGEGLWEGLKWIADTLKNRQMGQT